VTIVNARVRGQWDIKWPNQLTQEMTMASRFLVPARQGGALQRSMSLDPLLILQRDMDRLFGNAIRSIIGSDGDGELVIAPRIDVREIDGGIEIDAELPGVDGRNIEVSVDDDDVIIAGEMRRETQDEKGGYRVAERQVGRFRRVIRLPFEPDPEKVDAQFKNGILSVKIAQPPKADRTKRIAVKSDPATTTGGAKSDKDAEAAQERAEALQTANA